MWAAVVWAPDGQHVVVCGPDSVCLWDFSCPEAPPIVTVDDCPFAGIQRWSPDGTSYFRVGIGASQAPNGPATLRMEERRAADGSLLRAFSLGPGDKPSPCCLSPDTHALVLVRGVSARVVVFDRAAYILRLGPRGCLEGIGRLPTPLLQFGVPGIIDHPGPHARPSSSESLGPAPVRYGRPGGLAIGRPLEVPSCSS